MNQVTKNIIAIIVFIASFGLVCFGQSQIGYAGLAMELVGLAGLLIPVSYTHPTLPTIA